MKLQDAQIKEFLQNFLKRNDKAMKPKDFRGIPQKDSNSKRWNKGGDVLW